MTALDDRIDGIFAEIKNPIMALGIFKTVAFYEPKAAPPADHCALWGDRLRAIPRRSGLATAAFLMMINCRIYNSYGSADFVDQTAAAVEPKVFRAAAAVMGEFIGNFTLETLDGNIDVLGDNGFALDAVPGYINHDGIIFRVITVQIPVIINDLFAEVA